MSLELVPDKKPIESTPLEVSGPNQMTRFAAYLKEHEGEFVHLYECDKGFIIYIIKDTECYIREVYVDPQHRRSHVSYEMADVVVAEARKAGCKFLTGSVIPTAKGSQASLEMLLKYDMKLLGSINNLIWFKKDI